MYTSSSLIDLPMSDVPRRKWHQSTSPFWKYYDAQIFVCISLQMGACFLENSFVRLSACVSFHLDVFVNRESDTSLWYQKRTKL